jgi:hypothetical protein
MSRRSKTNYRISEWDVRRLYNESEFKARFEKGEFQEVVDYEKIIGEDKAKTLRNTTAGTRSQYVLCIDKNGDTVLEVHRYLNPDGTLGGSGKNDPKRITIKGITYGKPKDNQAAPPRLSSKQINAILGKRGFAATLTYINSAYLHLRHLIFKITGK